MAEKQKNILILICDQLTWRALPYYGNTFVKTPNLDRITRNSAAFDACYCSFPLCMPSRCSFWSGIYPHETGVLSNGRHWPNEPLSAAVPTLGSVFSEAGYRCVHFGKTHDAGALRGFEIVPVTQGEAEPASPAWPIHYDTKNDVDTAKKAVDFLRSDRDPRPLLMVTDFNNPHDICGWIGDFAGEHENPWVEGMELPPLPENFVFDDIANRPRAVQYLCCSHNRQAQTARWSPRDFRYYLAAYYHFIQRVDEMIGLVLDALEESGRGENTLVVFMADHGDALAARAQVTKQVSFYEEVTRVPFVFHGPGVTPRGGPITGSPVSTLDLFPTLCGYAGIKAPGTLRGMDLSPVLRGERDRVDREYVASEWHTEWGFTVSPGRMIRTERFKYTYYIEDRAEELFDLKLDPFEKRNLARDPQYAAPLEELRGHLRSHLEETGDDFLSLSWKADPEWRCHPLGYHNHRGPAAPEAIEPAAVWLKRMRANGGRPG